MRITIDVDDASLESTKSLTGLTVPADALKSALVSFVEHESARRLARLGGTEQQLKDVPRRHSSLSSR